jgi:hypothetical protein
MQPSDEYAGFPYAGWWREREREGVIFALLEKVKTIEIHNMSLCTKEASF